MNNLALQHGWSFKEPVAEDGSARRYERYEKDGSTAVLMTVYGETPGHRLEDFVRIGGWLNDIGLRAPELYEVSEAEILMEDFGDVTLKQAMLSGGDGVALYRKAELGLSQIDLNECPLDLPKYYDGFVHEWRDLILRWYVPALRGEVVNEALVQEYLYVWDQVEEGLPECPQGFLHMDYHAENLMVLPSGDIGVLDFQGAMIGPKAYDLVNLCEDMRFDVPADIQDALLADKDEDFLLWYRVLGTQFHCRLIGQCVRWAVRDDKPGYMQYIPRLFGYMEEALVHPVLSPLKTFFQQQGIDFEGVKDLDVDGFRIQMNEKG